MKKIILFSTLLFSLAVNAQQIAIVPQPNSIELQNGSFEINNQTKIVYEPSTENNAIRLRAYFINELQLNLTLVVASEETDNQDNTIFLTENKNLNLGEEGYTLTISPSNILISSSHKKGSYWAIQSLHQLWLTSANSTSLPALHIVDAPMFKHRGLLLDCSRHMFPVSTIKKHIDLLSYYKMNVLHWHLTDDQGWRIEIEKYPNLTEIGASRLRKDGKTYSGHYSKNQIKEVVEYAASKNITIIPEIEMPGHAQAAIASYPYLSCTGEQVQVPNDWGVFKEIYCAGNDSVFSFLEDVLTEVMQMFPSTYIHIGGDEVPKYRWENCNKCQKRMADENLENEEQLQSYFIKRIEAFLEKNNRKIIGWDEILEGGISANASVQSWRGMEYGSEAAASKHNVIMSPTSHCYLDYDLSAIDLETVYQFNPIPENLNKSHYKYILGAEVNMWTEHVPTKRILDNKIYPRMIAMAEVLWTQPESKSYDDFYARLQEQYPVLTRMEVDYGLEADPVRVETKCTEEGIFVVLQPGVKNLDLFYSYDEADQTKYTSPFMLTKSGNLKVVAKKNNQNYGEPFKTKLVHHLASGKPVEYKTMYSKYYPASGKMALTDGQTGAINFRDKNWQAFEKENAEIIINLGDEIEVKTISATFLQYNNAWIFLPTEIEIYTSLDGENWTVFGKAQPDVSPQKRGEFTKEFWWGISPYIAARFIRFTAKNIGTVPEWHEAAGSDAWLFLDEIIVE